MRKKRQLHKDIAKTVIVVTFNLLLIDNVISAQNSFEQEQEALKIIANFADRICKDIPLQGKQDKLELSGKAKAELRGIVKKFADLGLEGAAKHEAAQYEGLLQSDLLSAIQNSANCKLKVFDSLKDKLLPQKVTVAPFKPNPPSQLNIRRVEKKGFLLSWIDNSTNELGFNIYRKHAPRQTGKGVSYVLILTVAANTTQYFDQESYMANFFEFGDKISYQVTSYNETGESERIELTLSGPPVELSTQ